MSETSRHLRYWAKTSPEGGYHPVLYHCLDVAAAARALLEVRPRALQRLAAVSGLPVETLLGFVPLLLSFHDLGKLADGFQGLARPLMESLQQEVREAVYDRELFRHDSVGYAILDERLFQVLPGLLAENLRDTFTLTWLSAVLGHHGRPPVTQLSLRVLQRAQFPPVVARDLDDTLLELMQLFLPDGLRLPSELDEDEWHERSLRASWLFAGLAVLADWLGSNPTHFPPNRVPSTARDYYEQVALPAARRAAAATGLIEQTLSRSKTFAELWPAFAPTPLQLLAASLPLALGPQLIVIEEVTGGGKTEAAFTLAHRLVAAGEADGLYFGLPTMATANAMFDRIQDCWKQLFGDDAEPSLVLAHAKRQLRLDQLAEAARQGGRAEPDTAISQCVAWLADSRKKALLAEVGVGTIDQALLAVLQARHQSLRLWGLAGKVLIVDEVHAADDYMQRLLAGLLEIHAAFGGSAILLSATLPQHQRATLVGAFAKGAGYLAAGLELADRDYPALLHFAGGRASVHPVAARPEASRTLAVRLLHQEAEVDAVLLATLEAGGCACWVRNTVGDAIAAWKRWSELWGPERVSLFHARFTVADRHRHEQEVLRRFGKHSGPNERAGRLLIATQVVEQSLDLDFDTLVSDLAPVDLLIQRAGRLRRHARDSRGARVATADARGEVIFQIFTPPPSPEAPSNWFSSFLAGASVVYPDHGKLWAGASWLAERKKLRVPEDLRDLIEAVYSPESELVPPEALVPRSEKAEGKAKADRSVASGNLIGFALGYEPAGVMSTWRDDVSTPTRLGDPTVTLRLGRLVGGEILPLHEGDSAWELSEISVRHKLVAAEAKEDQGLIEKTKAGMPDQGKWKLLLVMHPEGDGFAAAARGPGDQPIQVIYSSRRGLETIR